MEKREKERERQRGGDRNRVHKEEKNKMKAKVIKMCLFIVFFFFLLVGSDSLRNSNIPQKDAYCGLRRDLFPAPNCTSTEQLNDMVCFGLSHEPWRNAFKNGMIWHVSLMA